MLGVLDRLITTEIDWSVIQYIGALAMDEISNYFIDRNSSGFAEGLNNKIKVLKRRCYGIFNVTRLLQRLHLDVSGCDILFERS